MSEYIRVPISAQCPKEMSRAWCRNREKHIRQVPIKTSEEGAFEPVSGLKKCQLPWSRGRQLQS